MTPGTRVVLTEDLPLRSHARMIPAGSAGVIVIRSPAVGLVPVRYDLNHFEVWTPIASLTPEPAP